MKTAVSAEGLPLGQRCFLAILALLGSLSSPKADAAENSRLFVPPLYARTNGPGSSSVLTSPIRIQQIYDRSLFGRTPILIRALRWRPHVTEGRGFTNAAVDLQIHLSATSARPEALSAQFAENIGPNETEVLRGMVTISSAFSGPAQGPKDSDIVVQLTHPFRYDPDRGNLLIDVRNFSGSASTPVDGAAGFGDGASRAFSLDPNATIASSTDQGADILAIDYTGVVPESPATFDLSRDFAVGGNPNGPWSYGYVSEIGGAFTLMDTARTNEAPHIPVWSWSVGGFSPPDVHFNAGTNTFEANGGLFPPGSLWVCPGIEPTSRNYAVMRLSLPEGRAGQYRIEVGARTYLTNFLSGDTDFHIVHNRQQLLNEFLPARTGFSSYSNILALAVGDTVDLVVGRGEDGLFAGSCLLLDAKLFRLDSGPSTNCVTPPGDLISWWPAEGDTMDAVGVNAGSLVNGGTFATGKFGQGFQLDGADDYLRVPDSPSLDLTGEFTLEAWYKSNGEWIPNTQYVLFDKRNYHVLNYGASLSVNYGLILYYGDPMVGGFQIAYAPLPTANTYHHFVGTYRQMDASHVELRIYTDGQLVRETVLSGNLVNTLNDDPLTIGSGAGRSDFFKGIIDEPAIYRRALTAEEIRVRASQGPFCTTTRPPIIVTQPRSQTAEDGGTATLTVGASGTPPLRYQWYFNGTALAGANEAVLTLNPVQFSQAGNYFAVVGNSLGSATSAVATLTVTFGPARIEVVSVPSATSEPVILPIRLRANGDENALGFSLNFDPRLLRLRDLELAPGISPGTSLLVNTNAIQQGQLGIAIALPTGDTFSRGLHVLVRVAFDLGSLFSPFTTPITFGDFPTARQISDREAHVLAADYTAGSVSVPSVQFEGDVSPRPEGDHSLTIIDWVQVGRFVAGLDTVQTTSEFQRADCAPRATRGNAELTVTDWVQAGRYATGLDPLTLVGGPVPAIGPISPPPIAAASGGRVVKLVDSGDSAGHRVVAVMLDSAGNENAVGFSVNFDPAKWRLLNVQRGAAGNEVALNVNSAQAADGRLGCVLALSAGRAFPSGGRELLLLHFAATSDAGSPAPVLAFADVPVRREMSDIEANALSTQFQSGVVAPQSTGPPIAFAQSGGSVILTWPVAGSDGFELESCPALSGRAWTRVNVTPLVIGGQKLVAVSATGGQAFFRLKRP